MFRQDIKNLASICAQLGVRRAVIAPGSRNTPLTLAFTAREDIQCYPVTDERSAGFFALGMAQYTHEPVVLVCTSGSAVLNFAPAVVEAYYQHLPLIVITADRPSEWIDQSDGQTIRQQNIYANYCKASFQLPSDQNSMNTEHSDRLAAQAVDMALQFPRGPVHLNVPLSDPLYVEMPDSPVQPRVIKSLSTETLPSPSTLSQFTAAWNKASRRMIIAGTGTAGPELNNLLNRLATTTETLVVAENLSGISGDALITTPDLFFGAPREEEKQLLVPELLITIGHSVISKQLKQYLRTHQPKEHWQVQTELPYADTYRSLNYSVPVKAVHLLSAVEKEEQTTTFRGLVADIQKRLSDRTNEYLNALPFCDTTVIGEVLTQVPSGWVVQLANSTPVRISQLFPTRADIQYFGNRGTSGIEGSVATAAGSAVASGKQTLLLSGDLSFLYDSNGMWNVNFPPNLHIIVLNNGGANIFSMIGDQKVIERCQPFFDAGHTVNLRSLSEAYGIRFASCDASSDLKQELNRFFEADGPQVLEVLTDRETNVSTYKELFKHIR